MARDPSDLHLPHPAVIEAYGNGGFRFGGLSHRGSLLCLPDGIWASAVVSPADLDEAMFAPVFARADMVKHVIVGTGTDLVPLPKALRECFRSHGQNAEPMATGAAVRTWNILFEEKRAVAALLIAV